MKKWISLLLMMGFCSLAYAHEEKDGMNPVGTYQLVENSRGGSSLLDTRTGQVYVSTKKEGWKKSSNRFFLEKNR